MRLTGCYHPRTMSPSSSCLFSALSLSLLVSLFLLLLSLSLISLAPFLPCLSPPLFLPVLCFLCPCLSLTPSPFSLSGPPPCLFFSLSLFPMPSLSLSLAPSLPPRLPPISPALSLSLSHHYLLFSPYFLLFLNFYLSPLFSLPLSISHSPLSPFSNS